MQQPITVEVRWNAEWKHNRRSLLLRMGVQVLVISAVAAYLTREKD